MSYDAMRWAMSQPVEPALTKFCLVAMAECVNSEGQALECWPSYAYLSRRTGMNTKTVEASVYRLKEQGYIVDTGKREGGTGKVVVYRLNDPKSGVVTPGPRSASANGTRPQNTPENGVITSENGVIEITPKSGANPPNLGGQSPQKVEETTPKTGGGIRNGIRKEPRKESGSGAAAPSIPGVPESLVADWLKVRKDKRAGPLTDTAIECLVREAGKASLTPEEAVRYCIEAAWQNFNAGFHAKREGLTTTPRPAVPSKHAGFAGKNYREGVDADGSFH